MPPRTCRGLLAVVAFATPLAACAAKEGAPSASPPPRGLGEQAADTASDTAVLREANDAVNAVVREASDCDAVKLGFAEAQRKLEEVVPRLRTATGKTMAEQLQKRLRSLADASP